MTVQQLINELKACNPEHEVLLNIYTDFISLDHVEVKEDIEFSDYSSGGLGGTAKQRKSVVLG